MKKKLHGLAISALAIGLTLFLYSNSSNPPNGRTGAPNETTCAACHSPNGGGYAGEVNITGIPQNIEAGETYTVTVTTSYSNGSPSKTGFQMVALNSSNNNSGTFSNPSANTTITPSGGRTYFEHNPAASFGGAGSISWTVDWTAPAGPNGQVITFYAASVIANETGNTSGDDVVTTSASGTLVVAVPQLVVSVASKTDITCYGASDGTATLNVTGGQPPYTYSWTNGETTNPAVNLGPGTHGYTVTDAANTSVSGNVTINQPELLTLDFEALNDPTCPDSENGSIFSLVDGGSPPYTYDWSNATSGADLLNVPAGTYGLTVTDSKGCTASDSWTLTNQFTGPEVVIIGPDVICSGSEITLSTQASYSLYEWSTGAFTQSITIDQPGNYSVTVTDQNGCTGSEILTVLGVQNPSNVINLTTNNFCQGQGSATISAAQSGGQYLWSTGQSTQSIVITASGTYQLTVTNNDGCSATGSYVFSVPANLTLEVVQTVSISCPGNNDAAITFSSTGGIGQKTFTLTHLTTGNETVFPAAGTATGLSPGNYSMVVKDGNNCTVNSTFSILEPAPLNLQLTTQNESTAGAQDGSATVNAIGGTTPYGVVNWSNGQTGNTVSGLAPGNYSVSLTDANGCPVIETFIISPGGCTLTASYTVTNVSCHGGNNGTISLDLSNEADPVAFQWSNGQTGSAPVLQNLSAGTYSVTLTDQNSCTAIIENMVVNQPLPVSSELTITHESTPGAKDGTASISVQGGTGSYVINWSNGTSGASVSNLTPGEYSVTVTDSNGCTQSQVFVINAGSTGTVNAGLVEVKVYPVPTSGLLYLDLPENGQTVLRLFRMDGKEIKVDSAKSPIDLSQVENGVYFLQILLNDGAGFTSVTKRIAVYKP